MPELYHTGGECTRAFLKFFKAEPPPAGRKKETLSRLFFLSPGGKGERRLPWERCYLPRFRPAQAMPLMLSRVVTAYRATPISPVSLDFTVLSVSVAAPVPVPELLAG